MDIECYFNVIRCRYHLTDRNCFLVFGWFGKDNPDGNTVEITLDNTVLEQAVDVFDDLPAHSFLRLIGANAQKEYVIRVSLPETLEQIVDIFAENLRRDAAGEPLLNLVDLRSGYRVEAGRA